MWKLGRILGIDVSLHWSLLLLIAWVGISAPAGGALGAVAFISAIFGCVLLHELGHSMAARQFGIPTASIVLLPIGGIASLERMPRKPLQELWIAVAGPLVNVVIASVLFLLIGPVDSVFPGLALWMQGLMFANMYLVLFNMLPAFPMDGGRVLRSMLALRLPYLQATQIAAGTGKWIAAALGFAGLVTGHLMWMLIAAFVYFAGSAEARMVAEQQHFESSPFRQWRDSFTTRYRDPRHFTARRDGQQLHVIWDEVEGRYRYAS